MKRYYMACEQENRIFSLRETSHPNSFEIISNTLLILMIYSKLSENY